MLKNIHPLLTPDLLHALRAMGHGDELALVDANFPAASVAQRLVRLDGADVVQAAAAILSVLPVDTYVEPAVLRMEVVGDPNAVPDVQQEFHEVLNQAESRMVTLGGIERFAFYERTRRAYVVIATGETRAYGDFLIGKGVILTDP